MTRVAIGRRVAEAPLALSLVTSGALDGRVPSGQRHARAPVLIERGRIRPRGRRVALRARAVVASLMRIAVAPFTRRRGSRFPGVAVAALVLPMRTAQRKARSIVIEPARGGCARQLPAIRGVTRGAIHRVDEPVVRLRRRPHAELRRGRRQRAGGQGRGRLRLGGGLRRWRRRGLRLGGWRGRWNRRGCGCDRRLLARAMRLVRARDRTRRDEVGRDEDEHGDLDRDPHGPSRCGLAWQSLHCV